MTIRWKEYSGEPAFVPDDAYPYLKASEYLHIILFVQNWPISDFEAIFNRDFAEVAAIMDSDAVITGTAQLDPAYQLAGLLGTSRELWTALMEFTRQQKYAERFRQDFPYVATRDEQQ